MVKLLFLPLRRAMPFEPPSRTVDTHEKRVDFTGIYGVDGWVKDQNESGFPGIQILFSSKTSSGFVTTDSNGD